jgi:hypothetical protein
VNLGKRYRNGVSGSANYTWSKLEDTGGVGNGAAFLDATAIQDVFDFRNELARSTLDVPHRFVANWNYELPFGKGRRWGRQWSGLTQAVLGGWQTSGIWSWQSGTPLNIIASGFPAAVGNAQRRADRVSGVDAAYSLEDAQASVRSGGTWFNPAAFAQPGDYLFGNAPRTNDDVRRDSYKNVNLSVLKNIAWGRQRLQFRAEFLNAFNMVVFGTPGRNVNDVATFGRITTQGNTPRIVQLVLRYTF